MKPRPQITVTLENQGEERIKPDKMIGMYLFTYRRYGLKYEFAQNISVLAD
jgi:hypothetical protein